MYAAPPSGPAPGYGQPMQPGYGQPPMQGGYGQPPMQGGYGQPPMQPGYAPQNNYWNRFKENKKAKAGCGGCCCVLIVIAIIIIVVVVMKGAQCSSAKPVGTPTIHTTDVASCDAFYFHSHFVNVRVVPGATNKVTVYRASSAADFNYTLTKETDTLTNLQTTIAPKIGTVPPTGVVDTVTLCAFTNSLPTSHYTKECSILGFDVELAPGTKFLSVHGNMFENAKITGYDQQDSSIGAVAVDAVEYSVEKNAMKIDGMTVTWLENTRTTTEARNIVLEEYSLVKQSTSVTGAGNNYWHFASLPTTYTKFSVATATNGKAVLALGNQGASVEFSGAKLKYDHDDFTALSTTRYNDPGTESGTVNVADSSLNTNTGCVLHLEKSGVLGGIYLQQAFA